MPDPTPRFRLTPSTVARYFKHRCDRLFRWDAVEPAARGKRGIGWGVPAKPRANTRPAVRLLMEGGDLFEDEQLRALQASLGTERVHVEGFLEEGGRKTVAPVSLARLRDLLVRPDPPAFVALLDTAHHPAAIDWVLARDGWRAIETDPEARASAAVDPANWRAGAPEDGFTQHLRHFDDAANGKLTLGRPPRDLVRVVAELALAGPAVCALRALRRIAPELPVDAPGLLWGAARVASGFRTLFNLSETVALLRSGDSDDAHWRRVLQYALDGNLQAVLDEHVHTLPESLGVADRLSVDRVEEVSAALASALGIRTSNLRMDEYTPLRGSKSTTIGHFTARCRFALRFAQIKDEREGTLNRIETVRDAFNSPFRPFILATTSIGQEGLDFHTWCHKLVHWNLPSNPVDLEQREGRVHRYKGHAVRKNIARAYGLRALAEGWGRDGGGDGHDRDGDGDPWAYLFNRACHDTSAATQDLSPFWVFETKGGSTIERLVPLLPFSREVAHLDALKRSLAVYRLAFGQARQEDLVRFLETRLGHEGAAGTTQEIGLSLKP